MSKLSKEIILNMVERELPNFKEHKDRIFGQGKEEEVENNEEYISKVIKQLIIKRVDFSYNSKEDKINITKGNVLKTIEVVEDNKCLPLYLKLSNYILQGEGEKYFVRSYKYNLSDIKELVNKLN